MQLKYPGGPFEQITRPDDHKLYFSQALEEVRLTAVRRSMSLETDLKPLYKKDKAGRWQTMIFYLHLDAVSAMPCILKIIETPGLKTKEYKSPIKEVNSKYYSDVVQAKIISAYKRKRDRDGWVDDKGSVPLSEPMLLHHYDEHKGNIRFPALISPKLNGIRATYKPKHGLMSRKRNPFDRLPVLRNELDILGITVDGELWHPQKGLEEISSMVKGEGGDELEYHIFDRPQGGSYPVRLGTLMKRLKSSSYPHLRVVPVAIVNSHEDIAVYFKSIKRMKGTDGAVVRNMDVKYQWDSRSKDVLKVKDVIHEEYQVVAAGFDVDVLGHLIAFEFETKDGARFWYSPAWTKEKRAEEYKLYTEGKRFIGVWYTLEFREYTKNGFPKFIMGLTERNYE